MLAAACAAPTLPLPPPTAPSISEVAPDQYKLVGYQSVEPDALVVIYNNDPALAPSDRVDGAQADSSGSWEKVVSAKRGSVLDIWQESGTMRSPTVTIQLP